MSDATVLTTGGAGGVFGKLPEAISIVIRDVVAVIGGPFVPVVVVAVANAFDWAPRSASFVAGGRVGVGLCGSAPCNVPFLSAGCKFGVPSLEVVTCMYAPWSRCISVNA